MKVVAPAHFSYLQFMHHILVLILLLIATPSYAAVYKWVDDAGRVHYSDKPRAGAKAVPKEPITTYQAPPKPAPKPAVEPAKPPAAVYSYIEINSPKQNDTVMGDEGPVSIVYMLDRPLHTGHRVQLLLDGKVVMTGLRRVFKLEDAERGEHQVVVRVVDEQDREVISSKPVSFFVYRHSILFNQGN